MIRPILWSALTLTGCLHASGTGANFPGDPLAATNSPSGQRQLVELKWNGSVLVGVPGHGSVTGIVVTVSGSPRIGNVVLRERLLNGHSLIQVSAPPELAKRTARVTLFFKQSGARLRLFAARQEGWRERPVQFIRGDRGADGAESRAETAGAALTDFGLIYLRRDSPASKAAAMLPLPDFDTFDDESRLARAIWHVALPAIVLMASLLLSRWLHSKDTAAFH